MALQLVDRLKAVSLPANLRINDQIIKYREYCLAHGCERPYHHFAFGQSPYPPPPEIVEALSSHASSNSYLPTAGLPKLRELIANYYHEHFGIYCSAEQVVISPGSKEMISILLSVLEGEVIIPTPSWVSYLPQARILGKSVITVRTERECQFKLTPDLLAEAVKLVRSKQSILILNHPNNPTGVVYTERELQGLAERCHRHKIIVISDEIYAGTSFKVEQFVSMGRVYPEGTIVTGGLSKDRSCGGYRLGVGVFPGKHDDLIANVLKVAGSTYSCVAAPIQHAAVAAYSPDYRIAEYMSDCRRLNCIVGRKMADLLADIPGVKATTPQGGFYLFVDFNDQREEFLKLGFKSCEEFCVDLIAVEHVALLPGNSLLLAEDDFAVRCSFVDFDGRKALKAWRRKRPESVQEENRFVEEYCPLIVGGAKYLGRYISAIRSGIRPEHLMD